MARKQKTYRRLPGNAFTVSPRFRIRIDYVRSSLWLASDHILHVRWRRFSENYKRFYLKDIQAIILSRTTAGRTHNLICGGLIGCIAVLSLTATVLKWPRELLFFMVPLAASFMLVLLINTLLGPTCACRLHTAVQVEDLMSLGRLRTARKVINILKPLIEAAQGTLAPEVLYAITGKDEIVQASAHALPTASLAAEKQEVRHENGNLHAALFGCLLLGSITAAGELLYRGVWKNLVDTLLFLCLIVLIILSLRRQSRSDLSYAVKAVAWAALVFTILNVAFVFVYGTIYRATHPSTVPLTFLESYVEGPVYDAYCIVVAIVESLLAMVGLIALRQSRAAQRKMGSGF